MFDIFFSNPDILYACDPVSAMLAISALTATATHAQQAKSAQAQKEQQKANMDATMAQGVLAQSDIQQRKTESVEVAATERTNIRNKSLGEAAKIRVAGGESGIDGASYDALLDEFDAQETRLMQASYLNEKLSMNRYAREGERLSSATGAKMLGMAVPIHEPQAGMTALKFAGDAANTYMVHGKGNQWGSWLKKSGGGGVDPNNFSLGHPNNPHKPPA